MPCIARRLRIASTTLPVSLTKEAHTTRSETDDHSTANPRKRTSRSVVGKILRYAVLTGNDHGAIVIFQGEARACL